MIAHTSVAVKEYQKSKEFYQKALAPLGYTIGMDLPGYGACGFKDAKGTQDFWIGVSPDASGVHVAFLAKSKEEVDGFHAAALAAGGKDNGAPGYRTEYSAGYYGAFIYDFDGSNIEAVWFDSEKN
jgi:predicted lactoylglutathione lyase